METNHSVAPRTVLLTDYQPLAWHVTHVALHFALDEKNTRVSSRLECVRNPQTAAGPLELTGEELTLDSIKIDGREPTEGCVRHTKDGLEVDIEGERAVIEIVNYVDPSANSTLSGLYVSNGGFFTQCEAQGFRRITYFPDRPDVMACFTVTLEADKQHFPVLLSNGNLIDEGELADGRHFATWEDPFPKPSYLFALVAADLLALERTVTTASGREVLLQVWVEEANYDRTQHAMESLIHAMEWDEATFGLELDLDRFMIVAVSDFNMGAMENKGLNIFNTRFVLARPDTATDNDYEGIESVVAHEYFHNWTGNRVTCRDWFQLTLKEGLTVFRDQLFSADMLADAAGPAGADSARAVKRLQDVKVLRTAQFAEDAGPMAHPIRPESYQEINNFYTATVYVKGAEVIRMYFTLLGREGFRKGMDLYFERHDGQAVTCDDFAAAMADANNYDLSQFMRWYSQAGTPVVQARGQWDGAAGSYSLTLFQHTPATPGQADKQPLVIPVALGLLGPDGEDRPLKLQGESHRDETTRVLELCEAEQTFVFTGLDAEPVPSLLRGFSAPVILDLDEDDQRLAFRMAHDGDAFNRWDAAQRYAERVVLEVAERDDVSAQHVPEAFINAFRTLINDESLDPAFRAQAAAMPSEDFMLEHMDPAEPAALRRALMTVMSTLGRELAADWLSLYKTHEVPGAYRYHPRDAGQRALRNLALRYLAAAADEEGLRRAEMQFEYASNMTEQMGALTALVQSPSPVADDVLDTFHARFDSDALVLDKWFALQASAWRWNAAAEPVLERVCRLMDDPAFRLSNPNKVFSLLGTFFRANPGEFHTPDGAGYEFWAEQVVALDRMNPQLASRLARALENWQRYAPELQQLIRPQLERVRDTEGLSPDVSEIMNKALAV